MWNKGVTPSKGNDSLLVLERSKLLHAPIRITGKGTLPGLESLSLIQRVLEQLRHNHHSEKGCFYCMGEPPGEATRFIGYISCMACMSPLYWRTITAIIIGMFLKSSWVVFPIFSPDMLYFRAFWHGTVLHAKFYYISSTPEAQKPQTYYQTRYNISWDITKS